MGISILQKLALSGSLSMVWSQLSELQIIDLFDLFNLKIPATWSTFEEHLDAITSLEFVDTKSFVK